LDFVTFHVSVASTSEVHPNQTLRHSEYMSMIDMMFASARLMDSSARAVVLTDNNTDFSLCRTTIDAFARADIDVSKLMLERTRSQMRYIEASAFAAPIIILDSDILINGSLERIFDVDFDVAVTWRERQDQPINGGFLILNNRRPDVARGFFQRFSSIYLERYADQAAWYGDQLALGDCVGLSLEELRNQSALVEVDGCRILLLPCKTHNFSPKNRYSEIQVDRPDEVVLHFKGARKRLMAPYWYAWLRPRRSFSPFVHLRARKERKALAALVASEAGVSPVQKKDKE